jgi:hypothetical protein
MHFFKNNRKFFLLFFAVVLILLFYSARPSSASALFQDGVIEEGLVITDDLFLRSQNISVDGEIDGILLAIGQDVTIASSAVLENDVIIIAQRIIVEPQASFGGNVILIAESMNLHATFTHNVYAAGAALKLGSDASIQNNLAFAGFQIETLPDSSVDNNLYAACYQALLSGLIHQNLRIATTTLELNGYIAENADIRQNLWSMNEDTIRFWMPYIKNFGIPEPLPPGFRFSDQAKIDGQLVYSSSMVLEEALNIQPSGGITIQTPAAGAQQTGSHSTMADGYANAWVTRGLRALRLLVSLPLCGLFALWLFPGFLKKSSALVGEKPLNDFGIGLVSSISVYIGLFVVCLFFVISAILFGLFSVGSFGNLIFSLGLASLAWVALVFTFLVKYISKLVVVLWLGVLILDKGKPAEGKNDLVRLALGTLLFVLVSALPYVGWIISLVVTLIGLGAMWYVFQAENRFPFLKWKG